MTARNPSVFAQSVALPHALAPGEGFYPFEWSWLDESIPSCFLRQVTRCSNRIAVQDTDARLTYDQLNRLANRLAHGILVQLGHAAEPVAILTGSNVNAVVAMMAILKAGKFFVAINPASSVAELRAIQADAGTRLVVTDLQTLTLAAALVETGDTLPQVISVDALAPELPDTNPDLPMASSQFAQIAYTSGSTGKPKGILKTHCALLHQSMTHINGYFITPTDRLMAPSPLIFGASLGIVFSALLGGATLLPIHLRNLGADQLSDWLRTEQITVYHSVASYFRQFAVTLNDGDVFPALRIIKLGGETIQPADVQLFRQHFDDQCVLRIGLASTETGNFCWHFIGKETLLDGPIVPAGRPLVGTEILLLDEGGQVVADGEVGEIAVRSHYLATGYWRNPELTRAKFLPAADENGATTYLTGDLGRWRPDHLLEHCGRVDQMVKIRGNRVEIGAVEAALHSLPAVKEGVVVVWGDANGTKRLLAYAVPVDTRITSSDLRAQLLGLLPDYMIPARFVWLDQMPHLPNGKVDRRALPPSPARVRPALDTPFVAPRTDLEQQIADIWAEVLEQETVGIDDNFFESGGDSLTLLRLTLLVEERLKASVPNGYFHAPTIRNLSAILGGEPAAKPTPPNRNGQLGPAKQESPAQWEAAIYGQSRALHDRMRRLLLRRGPVVRANALPYALGTYLQRAWLGSRMVRNQLLAVPGAAFARCLADAGMADPDDSLLTTNLMANTWTGWRGQALKSPAHFAEWVTVSGAGPLQARVASGKSMILVFTHQRFVNALVKQLLLTYGLEKTLVLTGKGAGAGRHAVEARYTQVALAGLDWLKHNGAVLIAGDGRDSTTPVHIPFFHRQLPLPPGFAELALHSQAALFAVFSDMSLDGRMKLEFVPLPTPATLSESGDLVRSYGGMLVERWPSLLPTMAWARLHYFQSLPREDQPVAR